MVVSLVKISKPAADSPPAACHLSRMLPAVTIDKFFLVGALAGFFGSIMLGAYVWLMRSGLLPANPHYHSLRSLHAFMQFYLFMTPFILGFLIQSAQKLCESQRPLAPAARLALPATVLAAAALLIAPETPLAPYLLAMSIWGVAACMIPLLLAAPLPILLRFGAFAVFGLTCLGAGVFFDLGQAPHALTLFWLGIVPIIFATAQQFIAGVLGGARPSSGASSIMIVLYSAAALAIVSNDGSQASSSCAAFLATTTLIAFLTATRAWKIFLHLREPIGFAFTFAHMWALGGALLLWLGPAQADSVLHVWGIGYALTLIIGVSLRLIGWITDTQPMNERTQVLLLATWQIVPLVRGLQAVLPFPRFAIWLSSACAVAVLAAWAASIATSVYGVVSEQARIKREARLRFRQTTNISSAE